MFMTYFTLFLFTFSYELISVHINDWSLGKLWNIDIFWMFSTVIKIFCYYRMPTGNVSFSKTSWIWLAHVIITLILSVHSKLPWHSVRFATNKVTQGCGWTCKDLHCFNFMQCYTTHSKHIYKQPPPNNANSQKQSTINCRRMDKM